MYSQLFYAVDDNGLEVRLFSLLGTYRLQLRSESVLREMDVPEEFVNSLVALLTLGLPKKLENSVA